jgi:hypothetical protein
MPRPEREEPIYDFLRSRTIIMPTLSLEDILSEFYPGDIFLSLSKAGKLYTS